MRFANTVMWTTSRVLEVLADLTMLSISLFGITLILIADFYLVRMVQRCLSGKRPVAQWAGNLAFMALVRGPVCGSILFFFNLPVMVWLPDFGFLSCIGIAFLMIVMGMLAGLICGGAFPEASPLVDPVLKAVKKWKRGGVWDPDFDGPA